MTGETSNPKWLQDFREHTYLQCRQSLSIEEVLVAPQESPISATETLFSQIMIDGELTATEHDVQARPTSNPLPDEAGRSLKHEGSCPALAYHDSVRLLLTMIVGVVFKHHDCAIESCEMSVE